MSEMRAEDIARRYLVEDSRAQGVPLLERRWYYVIEVEPGVFTPGVEYDNLHLTRSALRQVEARGLDCLDIGTMEAVVPILLARRGARRVVAYDRLDLGERIEFLKARLGVRFEYLTGFPFTQLAERLKGGTEALFDLVVFSGVLYHMLDPLGGLLGARRFLRHGGIMIFESAAVIESDERLQFNARGRYFGGDNFWLPSLGCLDYLLRFARLKPLDCFYLPIPSVKDVCRICVPCLAVSHAVAEPDDEWMRLPQLYDIREHLSWDALEAPGRTVVEYAPSSTKPVRRADGSVKVYESVMSQRPTAVTDKQEQVWLRLEAIY